MTIWEEKPLGVFLTERQEVPDSEKLLSGEIPVISKISFDTGQIELRQNGVTRTNMILICPGDLVLSGINAYKGAIAINDYNTPLAATIHYSSYSVDEAQANVRFVWWLLRSDIFRFRLEQYVPGGIKTELKAERFLPIPVPFPVPEEQHRLVGYIEEIASRISEAHNLRQTTVEELEKFFITELDCLLGGIPVENTLADVLVDTPRNGWSPKCDNLDDGVPVLTLTSITGFRYQSDKFKRTSEPTALNAHYWLNVGDILITRSNTPEFVGHAAIYDGSPYPCIYSDLMMRFRVDESCVDARYILYWLQSSRVRNFIKRHAKGTSPTMKKISQGVVMNIPYGQISLDKQRRIVEYLDELQARKDMLIRLQNETQAELDVLLPSVLDRAFKGEL